MKKLIVPLILFFGFQTLAQYRATEIRHYIKIEGSALKYYVSTLSENTHELRLTDDGIAFNGIYGWDFDEKFQIGAAGGFMSIGEAKGAAAFGEFNFFVSNTYINPYTGIRLGYSYIFPKNASSQGDLIAEFVTGLQINFGLYTYFSMYLQTGFMYTHKNLMVPLRIGIKF